ncbi:MAG: hypothetical protein WBV74_05220 [Pseudonocardiaceae bacterium]
MSSFPLGGKAPDRFFYALGRVSFETEGVSAHLDLLLQVLAQIEDMSILAALVGGEPISGKIKKCKRALGVSSVFGTGDVSELRRILGNLSTLVEGRNRYIHAAWSRYDEKSKTAHGTRARRTEPEDIIVSIEKLEGLANAFAEQDDMLLTIIERPYFDLNGW